MKRIIFQFVVTFLLMLLGLLALVAIFPAVFMERYPFDENVAMFGLVCSWFCVLVVFIGGWVLMFRIKSRPNRAFHKHVKAVEDALFVDPKTMGDNIPSEAVKHNFKILEDWVMNRYPAYLRTRREAKEKKKEFKKNLKHYNVSLD